MINSFYITISVKISILYNFFFFLLSSYNELRNYNNSKMCVSITPSNLIRLYFNSYFNFFEVIYYDVFENVFIKKNFV